MVFFTKQNSQIYSFFLTFLLRNNFNLEQLIGSFRSALGIMFLLNIFCITNIRTENLMFYMNEVEIK